MENTHYNKKARLTSRVTAWALVLVILFTIVNFGAFEAEADTSANDSAALVLDAMGVISGDTSGNYNLSKAVTRAEFAKMLVMASKYKDNVQSYAYYSIFRDVASGNWAAPYIKIAASNNLLSGYSDGTFRPNQTVSLEQGANSVLMLLGYTQEDFKGAFPYAQMNLYSSLGLSSGIVGGIGTQMTKGDAVQLIYNTLKADVKDGNGNTYAQSIGYSVNESGDINYAEVITDSMNGPYTVASSNWYNELGVSSTATVYRNGQKVSVSDVEAYDIVYYSDSKATVWAYNDKVTGIYESASPSQANVTSIVLSGTTYEIESTKAFTALSSTGTLKIGDPVTLLLGRNGKIADAVSSTTVKEETVLYVTDATTTKLTGVNTNGATISYTVDKNTIIEAGDVVKISFDSNGNLKTSRLSKSGIYGKVDSDLRTIGEKTVASSAVLIDTYKGAYTTTSLSRIDGMTIGSGNVLYYEAKNGVITSVIFNNVTGDSLKYGIITAAKSNSSGMNTSGSYTYDIKGQTYNVNGGTVYNVSKGPAAIYVPGDGVDRMSNLTRITAAAKSFNGDVITLVGGTTYNIAPDVSVYEYKTSSGVYSYEGGLSKAQEAYKAGKTMSYCYDSNSANKEIRVIIYQ